MANSEDVITLLTRQHRELEALLRSLMDAEHGVERATSLAQVADELAVHLGAEEAVFYPAVRARRTEDILLESLEEHLSLKRLVTDLMALSPTDTTWMPKCKVLQEQTEHHHKEEEEHLFPKVLKLHDPAERATLGSEVQAHEDALRYRGSPRYALAGQTEAAEPLSGPV